MSTLSDLAVQGLQIVWINVLLSGDNAVVIALAGRGLEASRRRRAVAIGSLTAVVLRIVFTIFIVALLRLPYVKLLSGLLLLWIAFRLLSSEGEGKEVAAASTIWGAVRTIALADAVMSLDNVVAVAAAARNSMALIVFGIALSVPIIIFGSTLILVLLTRYPVLVVAGAALLGWVAGEMVAADPIVAGSLGALSGSPSGPLAGATGAAVVLEAAVILHLARLLRRDRRHPTILPSVSHRRPTSG